MTYERFQQLAEAYGGDMARWPVAERDQAALFMAQEPDLARRVLEADAELDLLLDGWRMPAASVRLQDTILAAAPASRRRGLNPMAWLWGAGAGAGLAAACAAGLVLGVALSDAAPLQPTDEAVTAALASYDELSGLGVGEGA
ncbi:hypothetical protein [Phenylobacterium koreense]|uniref:Anti-sigma factor n=1 Tax=Phenylobacterium koreense TaxID=266125 RepID=A0ABV2EEH1_9CAUL